jgi:hypothetical protein
MAEPLMVALTAASIGIACESDKKSTTTSVEHALSAFVPAPPPKPTPPAEPAASAEPLEPIEVPAWVEQYATALCKRVGVCREKMLSAVPPQQKTMLAMQIPSQEACFKNTTTFKEKAPPVELDDAQKKALESCLESVPRMACGDVQTGRVPECKAIAGLIAEAKGDTDEGAAAAP